YFQDSIEGSMRFLAIAPLLLLCGYAADLCPPAQDLKTGSDGAGEWRSYSARPSVKRCVDNRAEAAGRVEWPAAGVDFASVDGVCRQQVCRPVRVPVRRDRSVSG